jgi:hypothetical protein
MYQIGANSPNVSSEWMVHSVPLLWESFGRPHINVLKMDCEGCEYTFADDLLSAHSDMLAHVDQVGKKKEKKIFSLICNRIFKRKTLHPLWRYL